VFVLGIVVVLSVAELTSERFKAFTQDHSLFSTFITEAVLLVGVYLVIDEIIERRDARRWQDVMSLGMRALSTRAEGPAGIVRRAVDESAVATQAEQSRARSVDYEGCVSRRSDELVDWLRADDSRERSFAEQMRQSASRLEDAIIRWGPTLIEDPESAELLNLLPDIVDSARSAADTIAPAAGRFDRVRQKDETLGTACSRFWGTRKNSRGKCRSEPPPSREGDRLPVVSRRAARQSPGRRATGGGSGDRSARGHRSRARARARSRPES
jgi:hypothetical protein